MSVSPEPERGTARSVKPPSTPVSGVGEEETVRDVQDHLTKAAPLIEIRREVGPPRPQRPKPKPPRGWRLPALATAVLVLIGVCVWAVTRTRPATATITRRDLVATLGLSGEVVTPPTAQADVYASFTAPVAQVFASVGQKVKKGAALVELSTPTARAAYEQARADVRAAQAAVAQAEQQYKPAVTAARYTLAQARAAEKAARRAAKVPLSAPVPTLPTPTPEAGSITITSLPPDLTQAVADRIAAEQALRAVLAARDIALHPQRQRLQEARAAFAETERNRKTALVRASISGTVLALNVAPGQTVGPKRGAGTASGTPAQASPAPAVPIAHLVDLERLQVLAPLSAAQADTVKAGQAATLTFATLRGQSFTGKVQQIALDTSGNGGTARQAAAISFENTGGLVKPDTGAASVSITQGKAQNTLVVPAGAIDRDRTGRPIVHVLKKGQWADVVVEPGLSDGRYTAIRDSSNTLREGQTIQVPRPLL